MQILGMQRLRKNLRKHLKHMLFFQIHKKELSTISLAMLHLSRVVPAGVELVASILIPWILEIFSVTSLAISLAVVVGAVEETMAL